jgi:hypothetical protein
LFGAIRSRLGGARNEGGVNISFVKDTPVLTLGSNGGLDDFTSVISFDPFLMAPFAGHTVRFQWNKSTDPILITPNVSKDFEWRYVLMPIRTVHSYLSEEPKPASKKEDNEDSKTIPANAL